MGSRDRALKAMKDILLAAGMAFAVPVFAAGQNQPPAQAPPRPPVSEEVNVTATRTPRALGETPGSVVVLSSQDLASTAAPTVDDALRQATGFSLFRATGSRTANPTTQGVSLRGVGASGTARGGGARRRPSLKRAVWRLDLLGPRSAGLARADRSGARRRVGALRQLRARGRRSTRPSGSVGEAVCRGGSLRGNARDARCRALRFRPAQGLGSVDLRGSVLHGWLSARRAGGERPRRRRSVVAPHGRRPRPGTAQSKRIVPSFPARLALRGVARQRDAAPDQRRPRGATFRRRRSDGRRRQGEPHPARLRNRRELSPDVLLDLRRPHRPSG